MMKNQPTKLKVLSSLFWKLMEVGGTQGIQFIVQIVLARLLLPGDYGIIALVSIVITLANVFVQSGFNTALIQKKDADSLDFSSVFYFSIFISGILYIIIYAASPTIAEFYGDLQLVPVLRVLSITLFFAASNSIQNAYVAKNMMFKKLFFSSLGAIITSGTIGILAAYLDWGVWALVLQQLLNQLLVTIILLFTVKWRPMLDFSFMRVKSLFSFGSKILVSSLLSTLYADIRTLLIGKIYSPDMLGFYNRGQQFPKFIVNNINGTIQSVMFPTLASHQDDRKRVKEMLRRSIVTSAFIMFPLMVGLAVVAEPLVITILTEKWLPAVTFLQVFCAFYLFAPIRTANLQAIKALGHSNVYLRVEIVNKICGLIILGISVPHGIYAIVWGELLGGILATFINAYPNLKLLNYSYIEQWKDLMPTLFISLVTGAMVYTLNYLNINAWEILTLQVTVGITLYIVLAKVLKLESLNYLIITIAEITKRRTSTETK